MLYLYDVNNILSLPLWSSEIGISDILMNLYSFDSIILFSILILCLNTIELEIDQNTVS